MSKELAKVENQTLEPVTHGVLEYGSNNSGGSWWLSDQNWRDLEAAGWTVNWFKDDGDHGERWLGALASRANKRFATAEAGVSDWSEVVGMNPFEEGCNCCGTPHSFDWTGDDGTSKYMDVEYGPISASFR